MARDQHAAVVEIERQRIQQPDPAHAVRAGHTAQADDGRHLRLDDSAVAGRRGDHHRLGTARADGHRGGLAQADAANGTGGAVHIKRPGVALQHGGLQRQLRLQVGVEGAGLAVLQPLAAGRPAGLAAADQLAQHLRHVGAGDDGFRRGPAAQQLGQGAGRCAQVGGGHDMARRGRGDAPGALADQEGADGAAIRWGGRGQLEHRHALFGRIVAGQSVQQAAGRRPTQGWEAFQRGIGGCGDVDAGGRLAGAAAVEGDAVAGRLGVQRHSLPSPGLVHGGCHRVACQPDLDRADQQQATTARQGAGVEDTAEIVRGERRWHRAAIPWGAVRAARQSSGLRRAMRAL